MPITKVETAFEHGFVSATMLGIWNHRRAVDLLQSLPEVDGDNVRVPVRELTHGRDTVDGAAEFELRDGKVAAVRVYFDPRPLIGG